MLCDLLEKLERSKAKKTHQHYVFAGPRGVGKTHLLSLLVHRIAGSAILSPQFTVVRFAEETHRLLSFADFLLRICEILGHQPDHHEWQTLYQELAEEDNDKEIIDTLQPRLDHYRKDTGRLLLLLVENLDEILMRQIKGKQDIHQLRKFLMTTPSCILIATSPIVFPGLTDVRQPFYDFFDIQTLDNLTQAETVAAIRANLAYDQRMDLLDRFDDLSPKIKALHEMTGGNPRLIMMHYGLIVDENVLEVKQQFEELLDRISPFYQDRVKDLPPQERAVLETMALLRTQPKTPALIARRLRKSPQQTSSLLKRLTKSGYLVVMDHPKDKRSKIYRIKEGFFDIWLSMNESRQQRKRLPALTEFFELWYEREEREQKRRVLIDGLLAGELSDQDKQAHTTTLDCLSDAGPVDEKIAAKLRLAALSRDRASLPETDIYLEEIKALKPQGMMQWLTDHREMWTDGSRWPDPISQIEDMIACWQLQRAGRLEEFSARLLKIGRSLQGYGLHQALSDLLISSAEEMMDIESKASVLLQAAASQEMMGDLDAALDTLKGVLKIVQSGNDRKSEGTALNNISQIHQRRGDYDTALDYLQQSLKISQEIGDRGAEGIILNNISVIYDALGGYETALDYLQQSLKISQEVGDRAGEGTTLNNISQIYHARGDNDRALDYLQQSLKISQEIGGRAHEGATLDNISKIYSARGDYDRAFDYLQQSLKIRQEIGDRAGEGTTLNNISVIYDARGDYDRALDYLQQSLKINQEIGDRAGEGTTLNNISQICDARGDHDRALDYLQQSLKIRQEIGDRAGLICGFHNMAMIARQKEDADSYVKWATQAYELAKETGNAAGLFHVGQIMGKILVDSGQNDEGLELLRQCLAIGKKSGMPDIDRVEHLIEKLEQS